MSIPPMPTQISCPKCQKRYVVQVRSVIDVGEEPELKEEFLRGQVNYAECPQCGSGGVLSTPLLYHDSGKELLISFVPPEMGMSAQQQEQVVGSLVKAVMNSVPVEKRKGYFLQPKSALTYDSLYDMVLEADGVSHEVLEKQRAQIKLLNSLIVSVDDDKTLDKLLAENRDKVDYEFFMLLSNAIEAQGEGGRKEDSQILTKLRDKLLARVNLSAPNAAPEGAGYDEVIELLQNSLGDKAWTATVAVNRQRLDYGFFQNLTGKIEAAQAVGEADKAKKLTELRDKVLDELDAQEKMIRDVEDRATLLIMRISEAADQAAAVRQNVDHIDQMFLSVLSRLEMVARSMGDAERAAKLHAVLETTLDVIEEKLPPANRLINKLMRAEYPDATNALLESHRGLLDDAFVKTLEQYVARLKRSRSPEILEHAQKVRDQIAAKRSILRA
jgi:hypothetical protein